MSTNSILSSENCPIHPNEQIAFLCGSESCHQRIICTICKDIHHSNKKLIPFQDIKDKKIFALLEKYSQEEGPENPEFIVQQTEAMFNHLKKEMDDAFEQLKKSTFDTLFSKLFRTKSWNTFYNELHDQYEITFKDNFSPRSLNLEVFTKNYCGVLLQLEKKEREPQILVKFPKCESERLAADVKDVFIKHQKRLLTFAQRQPLLQKTRLDLKTLKKEKIIKSGYSKGIKPTAIISVEDLSLIATSGDKDISLWSADTFEKIQVKQDVHIEPIVSLAYAQQKKLLLSCAWDRTLKLHSINKQGEINQVKTLMLPFGASISGILPIESKGVFLGGGLGPDIKIWSLQDYKLIGLIKTGNYSDIGPHLTYCKKENLIATFFYRIGKIGLFSLKTKKLVKEIETKMKANEIMSEAMLYIEKKSLLLASNEFDRVHVWNLQSKKFQVVKDIEVKGYYFSMVGIEEDDYVIAVNFMKELQVLSLSKYQVVHSVNFGLKNAGGLIHLKNFKRFVVVDSLSDKICILSYN